VSTDASELERFCEFSERFLILDNGRPFIVEEFQRWLLAPFFAGTSESVLSTPKGCGKSTLLGAVAIYELFTTPEAEIVVCAAARDQAAVLLGQAQAFVRRCPALLRRLKMTGREIKHPATGGRARVISSDASTGDGLIPTHVLADELHRWKSDDLWTTLRVALSKRGGQMLTISTAGVRERSPLWPVRERALTMSVKRDGARLAADGPGLALRELSAPDDANWRDIAIAEKVNPLVNREALELRFDGNEQTWRRFTLNQWVDADTLTSVIPLDQWQALAEPDAERPEWVVLGLDVAPKGAGAAIVAVGERDGELYGTVLEAGEGAEWVLPALERRVPEYGNTLLVDERRIAYLLPELERATDFHVRALGTRDVATACEFFLRMVLGGKFHHRGEGELLAAVGAAGQRAIGDGWTWSRTRSGADISPLCAMTWAVDFFRGSWGDAKTLGREA
jgi:phage terminase large subunit-like protein